MPLLKQLKLKNIYRKLYLLEIFVRFSHVPKYEVITLASVELNIHQVETDLGASGISIITVRRCDEGIFP